MNPIKLIKTKANFQYTLLAAVLAYGMPIFGVLMDDYGWYKWAYILGSHILGLGILLVIHKWYLETYIHTNGHGNDFIADVVNCPDELEPVLAKIEHINDLGKSDWFEVVYYDGNWRSYSGSKTFEDGEKVVKWKYCKGCLRHYC